LVPKTDDAPPVVDGDQENEPVVKKSVKISEPKKPQEYVTKHSQAYAFNGQNKDPILSPTFIKIEHPDTFKNAHQNLQYANKPIQSSFNPSISDSKMPIAMRRRVNKDSVPNYMRRPSLPKVNSST
jgi:hypothetical protein